MTARKKADKAAQNNNDFSRQSIEEQVEAFLKSGGEIQQIPSGVSGQQDNSRTRKHIVITRNRT
jgi:phage baseplate assembly protein gpV